MQAMKQVLSMVSDAITFLSHDLKICVPSPHLETLLSRPACDEHMQGVEFVSIAQNSESQKLADFLNGCASGSSCIHVTLKDSNSMDVQVQLYHACGISSGDKLFHLVCLREEADTYRQPPPSPNGAVPVIASTHSEAIEDDDRSLQESEWTMPLENRRGMAVWVRAEAALPIIKCTPEFVTFIGPSSVGTPLLEFVSNKSEFKSWVETCANYLIQGMRPNSPSFRVLLRFPQVAHEIRADAELTLEEEHSDDDMLSWLLIIRFGRMQALPGSPRLSL